MRRAAATLLLLPLLPAASDGAPVLDLPLACTVGRSCFVQQYVDHDPGPGAKDYRCGGRVYEGHDGVDIRLPSIAAERRGVAVLAAAAGTVVAVRDGEADRLAMTDADRAAIRGRACGNGVLVALGGGWQTQYCHMAKGSITVTAGQAVAAGARLGLVGLSGDTQFPHLHFSVRQGARTVDPFAPDLVPGACSPQASGRGLWSAGAAAALAYRVTEIINTGFADGPVTMAAIDAESATAPDRTSSAFAFYGRAIGVEAGDHVRLSITAPGGPVLAASDTPIDHAKAQWFAFAGKRRSGTPWPMGRYEGRMTIMRGGRVVVERRETLTL